MRDTNTCLINLLKLHNYRGILIYTLIKTTYYMDLKQGVLLMKEKDKNNMVDRPVGRKPQKLR